MPCIRACMYFYVPLFLSVCESILLSIYQGCVAVENASAHAAIQDGRIRQHDEARAYVLRSLWGRAWTRLTMVCAPLPLLLSLYLHDTTLSASVAGALRQEQKRLDRFLLVRRRHPPRPTCVHGLTIDACRRVACRVGLGWVARRFVRTPNFLAWLRGRVRETEKELRRLYLDGGPLCHRPLALLASPDGALTRGPPHSLARGGRGHVDERQARDSARRLYAACARRVGPSVTHPHDHSHATCACVCHTYTHAHAHGHACTQAYAPSH
jgi:ABC-type nickel/cobalt efflux system permease component RcnA